jgi:hypothetical protein
MADKREIILDLLARDKTGPATKSFGSNVEAAGKHVENAQKGLGKLEGEINKTEAELVKLGQAFADTDDKAERIDLSKKIRAAQNDLRSLNKSKGLLESILPDPSEDDVKKWTTKLKDAIGDGLADLGPLKIGAGVLGAALAPTIGGAIAGAVVGAVGLGGIIGGLALVAKDPAIKSQATNIGHGFMEGINKEAKDAFLVPAKEALGQVESLAVRSVPKIGKIFDSLAPSVGPLTKGVTEFADALLNGAVNAAGKAGPVMDSLGRIFADTGTSLGDFLTMAGDHAEEGASSLDDLNDAIQNTISVTTTVVGALASFKGALDDVDGVADKVRYWLEDNSGMIDLTADGYKKGSAAAELYRQGLIGVAGSANDYNHYIGAASDMTGTFAKHMGTAEQAADGERGALVSLANEMKAQTDPVFGLLDAEDKLSTAQKAVTKSTKDHGAKSKETKAALRELAEAAIDLEGKAGSLGSAFNGKLTPELKATLHAAGLTTPEINALGEQFKSAKKEGNAFAKKYGASLAVANYKAVWQSLYNVKDIANDIPRSVTIAMRVTGTTNVSKAKAAVEKQYARAAGGPVSKGVPYWVGEAGPELILPEANGRVLTAAASRSATTAGGPLRAGAVGSGGGGTLRLELVGQEQIKTMFRYLVRTANLLQGR